MAMGILFVIFFALPILAIALIVLVVYYGLSLSRYKASQRGEIYRPTKKKA